ncbi:hypothetical protein CAEBREN_03614 [Caenorhabditis brenneri]|uniref:Uncharacterized protein n=1 Tax=Caenorhabditis brenneri TaxID=135651 RepID=G0NMQ5_CAEBE|nr:hypothetical protein CAEBREN_03614 [Caenorhabditis brenneri]
MAPTKRLSSESTSGAIPRQQSIENKAMAPKTVRFLKKETDKVRVLISNLPTTITKEAIRILLGDLNVHLIFLGFDKNGKQNDTAIITISRPEIKRLLDLVSGLEVNGKVATAKLINTVQTLCRTIVDGPTHGILKSRSSIGNKKTVDVLKKSFDDLGI